MKVLLIALVVVGLSISPSSAYIQLDQTEIVDYINSLNTTWKASQIVVDPSEMRQRYGGNISQPRDWIKPKENKIESHKFKFETEHFDARQAWPGCKSIPLIWNQGTCNSSWAISSVSVMSDRLCIKSRGKVNVVLSPSPVISCCSDCNRGCEKGGRPTNAMYYWMKRGLSTGGPDKDSACYPLELLSSSSPIPDCKDDPAINSCLSEKYYGEEYYAIEGVENIMTDIMYHGPVTAQIRLYGDFYFYKSGVYHPTVKEILGYHNVKLIGWGREKGIEYWIAANSWGPEWGENGYVRIARDISSVIDEAEVLAAVPKL